jgi:hypothetical protein
MGGANVAEDVSSTGCERRICSRIAARIASILREEVQGDAVRIDSGSHRSWGGKREAPSACMFSSGMVGVPTDR